MAKTQYALVVTLAPPVIIDTTGSDTVFAFGQLNSGSQGVAIFG